MYNLASRFSVGIPCRWIQVGIYQEEIIHHNSISILIPLRKLLADIKDYEVVTIYQLTLKRSLEFIKHEIIYHNSISMLMYCFHRSWLSYDYHSWASLPGLRRDICTGRQLSYMWPPVALMVVENIKSIWYLPTTSTTKSPNLIVRIRSPQVTAGPSAINPTKGRRSIRLRADHSAINPI